MKAVTGKTTLVTGSSRGIGAAIARLFAEKGANVAVHGRDTDAIDSVVNAIVDAGGNAIGMAADLTRFSNIEAMRQRIEQAFGSVDILIANAGSSVIRPSPIEAISEEDWRSSIDGNLTATFLTLKSFLPGMKQRGGGTVITLSSAAARRPHEQSPVAYAAAKAGIQMLTRDVAAQVGPCGIRANCIAPETILTDRNRKRIPEEVQATLASQHPVRRLGTPQDVAQAALFLAKEDSSWMTGVTLDVAGGAVMV